MRATWVPSRCRDDGVVVVWALALMSVLMLTGALGAVVVSQADLRSRAGAVADLAAVAGAQSPGDACAAAEAVVTANGLRLIECARDGPDIVVGVRADSPDAIRPLLAFVGSDIRHVTATARAGPP